MVSGIEYPGAKQAISTASVLSVVAWIFTGVIVIIGIISITYSDPLFENISDVSFFDRHPFAELGIQLMIVGSVQMMLVVMVANFIKATMAFNVHISTMVNDLITESLRGFPQKSDNSKKTRQQVMTDVETQTDVSETDQKDTQVSKSNENTFEGTPSANEFVQGWYPDPYGEEGSLRWWTGTEWEVT